MAEPGEARMDALLPPEMAAKAEEIGVKKAHLNAARLFVLAVLAGAFIALGAAFATTVLAGAAGAVPYGIARLFAGVGFLLCLLLVLGGCARPVTRQQLLVLA